ncbi:UNVERIFIED_CONTAM: 4-amino-4-deoxy-L-arabinose transferase and related glycosyltransferases of PMT family [Acetivibrio alkalicellulosi]
MTKNIRNITTLFFSILMVLFVAITVLSLALTKTSIPILKDSPLKLYTFILLLFLGAIVLLFLTKYFLKDGSFISKHKVKLIVSAVLLTAITRLIWINIVKVVPMSDFHTYHRLATRLANGTLEGNTYISLFPHVIGYPSFLSIFYKLFGAEVIIAQLLNIALSCGIVLLLYFIGKAILNERCGLIASLLWAIWPSQIFYNSLVATEHLFTFLMLLCIFLFFHIFNYNKIDYKPAIYFALLGILCGIANSIRPLGLLLIISISIFYFVFNNHKGLLKYSAIRLIVFIALPIFFLLTSHIINTSIIRILNQDIAKSSGGFSFFVGSNINHGGIWNKEDSDVLVQLMKEKEPNYQEIHDELFKRGLTRYKSQSFKNVQLLKNKHYNMWCEDSDIIKYISSGLDKENASRIDIVRNSKRLILLCNYYYYVVLILFGISAFIVIRKKQHYKIVFLYIIISGMIAFHMLVEVASRYHYPAISIFSLAASYSLINSNLLLKKIPLFNR